MSSPPPSPQVLAPGDDSERFNAYCAKRGHKKSTPIARLARGYLTRHSPRKPRATTPEAVDV